MWYLCPVTIPEPERPDPMIRSALFVLAMIMIAGSAAAESWQPPVPDENGWDWIRMTSGEWFGGEIKLMRDRDLEFDSDELGILNLDITDVAEIRTPRTLTFRFDPGGTVTGPAHMKDGTIVVATTGGERSFPAVNLVLIMEGHLRERNFWMARGSLGIVTRSGNTSQTDMNSSLRLRRLTPGTRGLLNYAGNFGKVDGEETTNNHNVSASFDILVASGFFVTPISLNFLRDPFQNLNLKSTVAAGVGYDILRDGDMDWGIGLNAGYQETEYVSVEEGNDAKVGNATIVFLTDVAWDITDDLEMILDYNVQIGIPDPKQTFHHAQMTFSFDILGDVLDLDLGLVWDRVESPQANAEGEVPERDDFRSTIGIGFEL
jgi:putative salt-induced outer membrane protein YdiY